MLLVLVLIGVFAVARRVGVRGAGDTPPGANRWQRGWPNRLVRLGALGSGTFGVGFVMRWVGPNPREDLVLSGAATGISLVVLGTGLLLARRAGPGAIATCASEHASI